MKKTLTMCLLATGVAGLVSCAKARDGEGGPRQRQAAVVLQLYMDKGGACKLTQRTPGPLETAPGRVVRWFVVGGCAAATVGISQQVTKDGEPYDPFEPNPQLEDKAPAPGDPGGFVVLHGTIRRNAEPGSYQYQVLINGAPAEYNSLASTGDFEICPKWPCDGVTF
jgi:hypothetical protein